MRVFIRFRFRSAGTGWAVGLVVLAGGIVPSWGQTAKNSFDPNKGNDQAAYRQALQRSIDLANQEKKYAEAIQEALRAQEIARKAFGPASDQADQALHVLRQLYSKNGDFEAELRTLRERLELGRERLGPRDGRVKDLETQLALLLARLAEADGDLVRARSQFERALVIRMQNGQPRAPADFQSLAALHEQVGRLLQQIGDHEAAKTQYQMAAAIRLLLADHSTRGRAGIGGIRGINDNDVAFSRGRGGLSDLLNPGGRQESQTRRPPGRIAPPTIFDLPGFVPPGGFQRDYRPPGKFDLKYAGSMIGYPTHPWSVRERVWMMIRKEQLTGWDGTDAGLKERFLRVHDLERRREMIPADSWIAYARCLRNLAVTTRARGDRESARRMRLLSIAIGLEASDPSEESRPSYAEFLDDFVGLLEELGELDLAESLALWSLLDRRAAYGERHPEYATGLARLAGLLRARGDLAQAMLLFEKALRIRREALGEDHPDLAAVLLPMAELYDDIGNRDEARRVVGRALAISDALLGRSLPSLPERQRLAMLALRARSVSTMLDITTAWGGPDAETYAHLVPWKGITVEVARVQRTAAGTGEVAALRTELARARVELNRLYYAVVPAEKSQEHARQTRSQVERSAALEARLAEAVGWKPVRIGPPEVQSALPAGSVFIDIYHYQRRGRPTVPEGGSPFAAGAIASRGLAPESGSKAIGDRAEGHYVAFVVRRGAPPVRVELGRSDPIDREIQAWLGAIDRGGDHAFAGRQLVRAVWAPVAPIAQDATTILVSPDGALNFLPWGALPAERPGSYLLEQHAFAVVPSPRQLASRPGADEMEPSPETKGLLAVGGVDYRRRDAIVPPRPPENSSTTAPVVASRAAAVGTGPVDFPELPGTLYEVKAIADVYRKSQAGPVQLLTGAQATKDRLLAAMPGNRYLHLATHGYFAPPEVQSALNAGEVAPRPSWEEMSRRDMVGYHPGLLSGLAWAGASNPTPDPTAGLIDRGAAIMTAEEVAALNLRGCDLAVLSACQTGLGLTAGGEGVLGLQRAFLQAGARTVVASLWRVNDAATYVLMEQFHTNLWVRKLPKLEALRQAQLAVLNNPGLVERHRIELEKRGLGLKAEKLPGGGEPVPPAGGGARSDPALWAAFVLGGDGR